MVKAGCDYSIQCKNADKLVDWDLIEQVVRRISRLQSVVVWFCDVGKSWPSDLVHLTQALVLSAAECGFNTQS